MLPPQLSGTVSRLAPGLRVQLVDLVPDSYVGTLERYEVDIGLIPTEPFPDWVDHQPLFWSDFQVIAGDGNSRIGASGVSAGATLPLDQFSDLGHVLFSPQRNLNAMGDTALALVGHKRRVVTTLPVFSGICRAVAEFDLIAMIPTQLARRIAPRAGLRLYQPPMPVGAILIQMIWHKRSTANPAHAWLRRQIAGILTPLNAGYPPLDG